MNIHTPTWSWNIFHEKYATYLQNTIPEQNIQTLMKQVWYLLQTGDKVFDVDQKNQCISVPPLSETDRDDTYIVRKTKRTKIGDAIIAINNDFPFISNESVTNSLIDILAYTNAYIKQTTKRWVPKLWSLKTKNMVYFIRQDTKVINEKYKRQDDLSTNLTSNPKNIPIHTLGDFIETLNTSTLPLKINEFTDEIIIDRQKAAKMNHLKAPKEYVCRLNDQKYTLDAVILRCIEKWWKSIEGRNYIEKHISTNAINSEKTKLYTYICQNLIKLYYINTEKHLTLKYDDGKDVWHEWKNIKMHIQFTAEHLEKRKEKRTAVWFEERIKKPLYNSKKRILKSNINDKRIFDVELICSLWYHRSYATWLYNFIVHKILYKKDIDIINVANIAYIRNHIHAKEIQEFHMDSKTSYFIKSLDNILENYLVDKARSYNDNWMKVSATNRQ